MTAQFQRRDQAAALPPDVDESYWASLLDEGEYAEVAPPEDTYEVGGEYDDAMTASGGRVIAEADTHADWAYMTTVMKEDGVVTLRATGFNRGGLLVEWNALRGFVPASQLIDFPSTSNLAMRRKALELRVEDTLTLRVIELDEAQNRLIFSERAARALPGERADILVRLQTGDQVSGIVTNLCDFGAFIDLGGLEGLIHISELSWGRVGHPGDLLERGQTIHAYVLEVNQSAGRIALSLKRLHPDPWETVNQRYLIGEMVTGEITNVVDFGAFARIEEGLEGLIHVSELAEGHFLHPHNVVSEGQQITARIVSIDGRARRLGLSLRESK